MLLERISSDRIIRRPEAKGAYLDTVLDLDVLQARNTGLESPVNPQAGKPALRSADILVCGVWRLSSRQLRTVFRCTQAEARGIYAASMWLEWESSD